MFRSVVFAIEAAIIGILPTIGALVAQVAGDGSAGVAGWVQLGGIGASITGLAYIAKKFADGTIVAFPLHEVTAAGAKREEALATLLEQAVEREDALRALLLSKGMGR